MSTRLLNRWRYDNVVPGGMAYVDTDDLFLFVRTTSTTVHLDHPVYYVTSIGSPDFIINMNDGSCLELTVQENPEPDVDKVILRIPKNSVRFELKEINIGSTLSVQQLLANALKYNGSYTASTTAVQGKWGFNMNTGATHVNFQYFTSSYNLNCYVFDEFRPFVMYYNGLYMLFYDRTRFTRSDIPN